MVALYVNGKKLRQSELYHNDGESKIVWSALGKGIDKGSVVLSFIDDACDLYLTHQEDDKYLHKSTWEGKDIRTEYHIRPKDRTSIEKIVLKQTARDIHIIKTEIAPRHTSVDYWDGSGDLGRIVFHHG